jgi:hypothetical protein
MWLMLSGAVAGDAKMRVTKCIPNLGAAVLSELLRTRSSKLIRTTMAPHSLQSLLLAGTYLICSTTAQIDTQLVGTWSTKSAKVLTGPVCFYSWNTLSKIANNHN